MKRKNKIKSTVNDLDTLLLLLPSELHAQLNITLPLLPTEPGATAPSHIFAAFLAAVF